MYHSLQSGRMLALSNDITKQTPLHPKHYLPIFSGSQIVQALECSAPVNIWHGYHPESPSEVLYHLRQKILSYPKIWLWISDEAIADICTVIEGHPQCECLKPKVYTRIVVPNSRWIAKTSKNITHASVYCDSNSAGVTSPKTHQKFWSGYIFKVPILGVIPQWVVSECDTWPRLAVTYIANLDATGLPGYTSHP